MKDINQLMDTVDAKWELAYTVWRTQIVSTEEIEAIDEIFRKQLSTLREINNAFKVKLKEKVQQLAEEMAMIKANEHFKFTSFFWMGRSHLMSKFKLNQQLLMIRNQLMKQSRYVIL
jgi:hypothetical protein